MKLPRLLFGLVMACCVHGSHASNFSYLKTAPIAEFTEQDVAIMEDNLYRSLETLADGEKSTWKNDKTGSAGLAEPLKTYEKDGKTCRSLRLVNRSSKNINESVYEFCKEASGWKLSM